jgi:hypothetical protein
MMTSQVVLSVPEAGVGRGNVKIESEIPGFWK